MSESCKEFGGNEPIVPTFQPVNEGSDLPTLFELVERVKQKSQAYAAEWDPIQVVPTFQPTTPEDEAGDTFSKWRREITARSSRYSEQWDTPLSRTARQTRRSVHPVNLGITD